jgi:hypothetical protein
MDEPNRNMPRGGSSEVTPRPNVRVRPAETVRHGEHIYTKSGFAGVLITHEYDEACAFYVDVTHITQIKHVHLSDGAIATEIRHNGQRGCSP